MGALPFIASLAGSLAWPAAVVVLAGLFFRKQIQEVISEIAKRIPHLSTVKAPGTELTFDSDGLASTKVDAEKLAAVSAAIRTSGLSDVTIIPAEPKRRTWPVLRAGSGAPEPAEAGTPELPEPPPPREDGSAGKPDAGKPAAGKPDTGKPDADSIAAVESALADFMSSAAASMTAQYELRAMAIRNLANLGAPAEAILAAWSGIESLLRDIAEPLGIGDTGKVALLASEVITELGRRGALPAPDQTQSVVQRLRKLKGPVEKGAAVTKLEALDYAETAEQVTQLLITAAFVTMTDQETGTPDPNEQDGSDEQVP